MCKAPIGYSNKITEDGKKYIKPIESDAKIIKWAFEKVAQGQYNVDQIFKEASKRGIRCCRANFWNLIHNPVYCGKIYLSGYKDEQPRHVPGLHDPIITEDLFYEVQDYLNGKKKIYRTQLGSTEIFQLRGFILCPQCGKILTASASKGRAIKYNHYHCHSSCGTRFKAEVANELFITELRKFTLRPGMEEVYKLLILEEYKQSTKDGKAEVKQIKEALEKANTELLNARRLLLTSDIDPYEYRTIKNEYEIKISKLESQLIKASTEVKNIEPLINKAITSLSNLDKVYEMANNEIKKDIIGSIYPEKLTFDGMHYRTTRLNEAVRLI